MSSPFNHCFSKPEILQLNSSELDQPINFNTVKSVSIKVDPTKTPMECFKDGIKEWMSKIELNRDSYSIIDLPPRDNTHGGISINYGEKTLAELFLSKSFQIDANGKKVLSTTIAIKYERFTDKVLDINQHKTIFINDRTFNATHNRDSIIDVLEDIIPIRSEAKVKAISYILGVKPENIIFDSYRKKYIITTPYLSSFWSAPIHPKRFYKYVSLSTYMNMLKFHSFRMNSIISQSDETESLFIENSLCDEFYEEIESYKKLLSESNTLLSCFTTLENDPFMWEEYGDKGYGVMLVFESGYNSEILHPVHYIDDQTDEFKTIRDNLLLLKQGMINVSFSELDGLHRFIKSNNFKNESEWRLIKEYKGDLDKALYNDTVALYHDFSFTQNYLPDLDLVLSAVVFGPKQRKSNIPLLTQDTINVFGDITILTNIER